MSENYEVEMLLDIKTPMRDGVNLSTDIYLPKADGPFPAILMRTPYSNNGDDIVKTAIGYANRGYACVMQDVRGRWDSDGDYYPFHQEAKDGYDTQEWLGEQTWCNGNIGMVGGSYLGGVQWLSAPLKSKYLKAIAPRVMCTDYYRGLVHPGGTFQLNVMMTWGMRTSGRTAQTIDYHNWTKAFHSLPLADLGGSTGRNMPFWQDWHEHENDDEYWDEVNTERRFCDIEVPALIMGGWYDLYAPDAFHNFNGMREQGGSKLARQSRLIMGPWPHRLSQSTKTGDIDFGAPSKIDLDALERSWLDRWLRDEDNGIESEAPLRLFIMGTNEWRDEHEWPLARTDWQQWHLHSDGEANTAHGNGTLSLKKAGEEKPDRFSYNPEYPVQTIGGNNCCSPDIVPWGPYDQRPVESRSDVLCFTTDPMTSDFEVTGPIKLKMYALTDCLDTDWTAKVVDVSPDGYAKNLCDNIIRGRYRQGFEKQNLLEPGQVYEYEIDIGVTANVFKARHRIRLEVSSSNFPRFDRNLNTGKRAGYDSEMRVANQMVFHSDKYPSHLILPAVKRT